MNITIATAVGALLVLPSRRAWTGLSTHDTTSHTLRNVRTGLVRHVSGKVHEVVKLGDLRIFVLLDIPLKLGGDGRLDGHTLALGSR